MFNQNISVEMAIEHSAYQVYKYPNTKILIVVDNYGHADYIMSKLYDHISLLSRSLIGRKTDRIIRLVNGGDITICCSENIPKGCSYNIIFIIEVEMLTPSQRANILTRSIYNPKTNSNTIYQINNNRKRYE